MLEYEDFARLGTYLHELTMSVIFRFHVRYKEMVTHHWRVDTEIAWVNQNGFRGEVDIEEIGVERKNNMSHRVFLVHIQKEMGEQKKPLKGHKDVQKVHVGKNSHRKMLQKTYKYFRVNF